jgi:L,D-transpeptidase-like protein
LGFVCAGLDATIRLDDPVARAIEVEPDRSRALPYAYAFTRSSVPNYLEVPTVAQQRELEDEPVPSLLGAAAADVLQVSPGGAKTALAAGPAAPSETHADDAFGGTVSDGPPWWLEAGRKIGNLAPFDAIPGSIVANVSPRHAGVALLGAFTAGAAANHRRFAITTDARLLPADALTSERGSMFHGQDLRDVGLPIAFGWRRNARFWRLVGDRLEPGRLLEPRAFVALSGSVRSLAGERLVETRDGQWLRSGDLHVAAKPRELPELARDDRRWIDVSITNQVLVLWEGATPVYATLVSTGKDGLGDPRTTQSTPQGTFAIQRKHVTTSMDSDAADAEFELRDVPWVMYFKGGYALHGAYWHDDFGRKRSHGCINLSPIDARHVFEWSLPHVPEHWHGAYASDAFGPGTTLRVGR